MEFQIDYDEAIMLDAEEMAEQGIAEAYDLIQSKLKTYVTHPKAIEEVIDDESSSYTVKFDDQEFAIYSPDLDDKGGNSWGRATFALFSIVNSQLVNSGSGYRFFAINGGNDLLGIFLTLEQANLSRKALKQSKRDWPYLPTCEPPWYGEHH
ncbi:MAG TPA: hypothetical protein PKD05_11060 [Candidatus Melainabacteria bacterium]|nr:hypothetical protein [Candidatus Melainabacteria bacterium]